jgi:Protein of unknown function (DUF551).
MSTITRSPVTHNLKIWPEYYAAVCAGDKRAELRWNDRDYQTGDILDLCEWDPNEEAFTGEFISVAVTHVAELGQWMPGYVLLSIALASLEAEPVCVIDQSNLDYLKSGSDADVWPASRTEMGDVLLYRSAPPAPVSVPEWTDEQCMEFLSIAFRHAEINGDLELDDIRLGVKMVNGSRAAMLQCAENPESPSGNSPVIPAGWVACGERMPERDYVLAADFSGKQYPSYLPNIQIGIYADWFDDGRPCWDDGDGNDLHLKQVTHWAQIPAAPQQEV